MEEACCRLNLFFVPPRGRGSAWLDGDAPTERTANVTAKRPFPISMPVTNDRWMARYRWMILCTDVRTTFFPLGYSIVLCKAGVLLREAGYWSFLGGDWLQLPGSLYELPYGVGSCNPLSVLYAYSTVRVAMVRHDGTE